MQPVQEHTTTFPNSAFSWVTATLIFNNLFFNPYNIIFYCKLLYNTHISKQKRIL